MYPIPPTETLVETKNCRHCGTSFPITDKDLEFYEKVSPTFGGVKYIISSPTLCPDCRQQRRLSFHNERKLYKRRCNATGKDIISIYSPDKPHKIYHQDYWWSDKWDPLLYGMKLDFTRSFFEQWNELFTKVPRQAIIVQEAENSDFLNFTYKTKDCYLIFASSEDENCYYGNRVNKSYHCIDCLLVKDSSYCYECIGMMSCYNCSYSQGITNCRDMHFCKDCEGCFDCFMCINLKNKKFYIKNKQYTEEDYKSELSRYQKLSKKEQQKEFQNFIVQQPQKFSHIVSSEMILGENIQNAKNGKYIFDGDDIENVAYSYFIDHIKDSMDVNYGNINNKLQYESLGTGANAHNIIFSINTWPDVYNLMYCDTCLSCSYCFGCISLRNKQYCILNKQYTREEYEELVPNIIEHMRSTGEWGEFFPSNLSPFGYNETVSNEWFPLIREQALEKGFNWSDYEAPFPRVEKIIPAAKLPDDIAKIPDDILNWAIECEVTGKPFRIIKQELEFYRKHNLPIPRRHPDQRHLDRMALRNPRKLFERKCDKCGVEMMTTFAPKRPEMVYCEDCYSKEVM